MKNLSIVLKEESIDKVKQYISCLTGLLNNNDNELIIINNNLDEKDFDLKQEFRLFKYSESYIDFKEFCLDICLSDNIMLIESGVLLNEKIIREVIKLFNNNKTNIIAKFKTYISKDKKLYYIDNKNIIFNIKNKEEYELGYTIEDINFIDYDKNYVENYIYKFIEGEKYLELYKWYENILLKDVKNEKSIFYNSLEKIKLNLEEDVVNTIEDIFISNQPSSEYSKYLNLKVDYKIGKKSFQNDFQNYLQCDVLCKEDIYLCYLIQKLVKDNKFSINLYKSMNKEIREAFLKFLFKNDDDFYAYMFSYLISINSETEISSHGNEENLILYREIASYYLKFMSGDSANTERKKILIQMFIEYVNYSMAILNNSRNVNYNNIFEDNEINFLIELDKAITVLNNDNIIDAVDKLKVVAEIYEPTKMAVRYYIQQLIIDNNLYFNKLSICMIVKNEAKNLATCLESLKPLIEKDMAELIIVDTGSEDETVEIAKKYTNNIFLHPWQGSFSEARNHSISLALGEYIMIMDADLEIEEIELNKFIDYFNKQDYTKYKTISSEFINFENEQLTKYSKMTQYHIFKNDGTFYYSGKIHNQPQFKEPCKNLDITMLHYGYIMTEDVKDKKFYRTAELLKKELEKDPRNYYYRMQLMTSYSMHGDNIKALEEAEVLMKQIQDGKVNLGSYLMPYNAAAIIYSGSNLFDKVIEISDTVLNMQPDFIDLIYLKANAFYNKKMYKEAAIYYEDYLELLKEIKDHEIIKDDKIIFYTLDLKIEALKTLLFSLYELKDFEKLKTVVINNPNIELLNSCLYLIIKAYLESDSHFELGKLFVNSVINSNNNELLHMFKFYLVEEVMKLNKKEEILRCFSMLNIENKYIYEIKRMLDCKLELGSFLELIKSYDVESADILTKKMLIDKALPIILNFNFDENHSINEVVIIKNYSRHIINGVLNSKTLTSFNRDTILAVIKKYLEICISLLNSEKSLLESEESVFIEYFICALNFIDECEILLAIEKIRDGVIIYNKMANAMDLYLELIIPEHKSKFLISQEKNKVNEELDRYCKQIKSEIEENINCNEVNNAISLINEYEKIISDDVDIYSMKAAIEIIKGDFKKAEEYLLSGNRLDRYNFDVNYNLAYIYECQGDYLKALEYYKISEKLCYNAELIKVISEKILEITDNYKDLLSSKKKLVFFVKLNLDSFLGDIIDNLRNDYEIKKVIVTHYNQIDEGMEWADICWFEWCDELIIYGSKHKLAKDKIIICRLHSYEAFTNYPSEVQWDNVDRLILVSNSIKNYISNEVKYANDMICIIPNGVDLSKYNFNKHSKGFNICYVGYINYKKGPMLLLQVFSELYNLDNRYKLFIAGEFQDERYVLYFKQMIEEMGLSKNVIFEGWQTDINSWLIDKDFILCTSLLESQNLSVMQAMSKGIKPIIHNFYGANTIYPKKYLWNTISEAVQMIISETYETEEYKDFIKDNYSIEKQINSIKNLMENIDDKKGKFDYDAYWNDRLNSRFDIEGVGYMGLGKIYNKYLYKIRLEILDKILYKLYSDSIINKEVLELGPGIGIFTEYFNNKNITMYKGIDITEKSISELSKKYIDYTFVKGDISEHNLFENSKYDLIFAADVLLHITDEVKYNNVIKNIAYSLKDNGYLILFDPISMIGTKSESEHVVIRDINYIGDILQDNELELINIIPSSFFMNYPFDRALLGDKSLLTLNAFNYIQSIFSNNSLSDTSKEELGSWLSSLEKKCLISNSFGLSQKVLVIKRKSDNKECLINLKDIFDEEEVLSEETYWSEKIANNKELSEEKIVKKLKDIIHQLAMIKVKQQ